MIKLEGVVNPRSFSLNFYCIVRDAIGQRPMYKTATYPRQSQTWSPIATNTRFFSDW